MRFLVTSFVYRPFRSLNLLMTVIFVWSFIGGYIDGVRAQSGSDPWLIDQPDKEQQMVESFCQLPLYFIENQSPVTPKVKYYEKSPTHAISFTEDEILVSVRRRGRESSKFSTAQLCRWLGSNIRICFASCPVGLFRYLSVIAAAAVQMS